MAHDASSRRVGASATSISSHDCPPYEHRLLVVAVVIAVAADSAVTSRGLTALNVAGGIPRGFGSIVRVPRACRVQGFLWEVTLIQKMKMDLRTSTQGCVRALPASWAVSDVGLTRTLPPTL